MRYYVLVLLFLEAFMVPGRYDAYNAANPNSMKKGSFTQFTNPSGSAAGGMTAGQNMYNNIRNDALLGGQGIEAAQNAWGYDPSNPRPGTPFAYNPGAGGGGGGGPNFLDSWQNAYDQARQDNENRYNDILGQYQSRYDRNMGYINAESGQEKVDASNTYAKQAALNRQFITDKGMSGTTILPSMQLGVEDSKQAELRRINDATLRRKVGADSALSGDKLGFMERRTDSYPNEQFYANMAQNFGASGGGQQQGYGGGWGMPIMGGGQGGGYQVPGAAWGGAAPWQVNPFRNGVVGGWPGGAWSRPAMPVGGGGGGYGSSYADSLGIGDFSGSTPGVPTGGGIGAPAGGVAYYSPGDLGTGATDSSYYDPNASLIPSEWGGGYDEAAWMDAMPSGPVPGMSESMDGGGPYPPGEVMWEPGMLEPWNHSGYLTGQRTRR